MGDLGKGKNKVDDIGEAKHAVTHQKPLDVIRLSSESTPENPRMLGGTPKEAQNYYNRLPETDKQAFRNFRNYYNSLLREKNPDARVTAKEKYLHGYEIYGNYHRIHKQKVGESSTQETPKTQETSQEPETWDDWFDRNYPR